MFITYSIYVFSTRWISIFMNLWKWQKTGYVAVLTFLQFTQISSTSYEKRENRSAFSFIANEQVISCLTNHVSENSQEHAGFLALHWQNAEKLLFSARRKWKIGLKFENWLPWQRRYFWVLWSFLWEFHIKTNVYAKYKGNLNPCVPHLYGEFLVLTDNWC